MNNVTEQAVAIEAVRAAAAACQAVRSRLVSPETIQKKDKSPVTVADFASQAIVCQKIAYAFQDDLIIAEEDAQELRTGDQVHLRWLVMEQVNAALGQSCDEESVLAWIDHGRVGAQAQTPPQRFWTLDPIDGTKGFLRNEQYAVALALIENGQVVLGVLGCPNLQTEAGQGALLLASRGQGARLLPLEGDDMVGRPIRVSPVSDTTQARFCESVESGHSDQDRSVRIAQTLGITAPAVRMDSQAKYATVARGDAQIYLRLPTVKGYEEKIWDHAAGMLIVEEAGGKVTDIAGRPLDFTCGQTLARNRGVVATNGLIHDAVIAAIGEAG